MPIIQEQKGRYFVTVPKEIVKAKGWSKGTQLFASFNEKGNLELREMPV